MSAEEAADRISRRIQAHQHSESIPQLILKIVAEELQIHRLHLEERAQEARQRDVQPHREQQSVHQHKARSNVQPHGADSKCDHRRQSRERRRRHDGARHGPRSPELAESVRENPRAHNDSGSLCAMSGDAGPESARLPQDPPTQQQRRRRSPPLGPPPTYKPKLGFTMGVGTHVVECIKWEGERQAKEERRKERRARGSMEERRERRRSGRAPGSSRAHGDYEHRYGGHHEHTSRLAFEAENVHVYHDGSLGRSRPAGDHGTQSTSSMPTVSQGLRSGALHPDQNGIVYERSIRSQEVERHEREQDQGSSFPASDMATHVHVQDNEDYSSRHHEEDGLRRRHSRDANHDSDETGAVDDQQHAESSSTNWNFHSIPHNAH